MSVVPETFVPLESGDRLTREEFHRRYCLRPDIKKAELVLGVVYVASPVSYRHGKPHSLMQGWLNGYAAITPGVEVTDNTTVFLPGGENELQPDCCLYRVGTPSVGLREDEDGYLVGVPELVVEIAASSASYDLHDKMEAYRRAGVPEYIVWQVYERRIDWFLLREGTYVRLERDERGVISSEVFPGLRLAVDKMLAGDRAGVLAELTKGTGTAGA